MIGALLGPLGSIASTWLEGRNEKIKAEAQTKVAIAKSKAEIASKQATGEIELQQSLTEQMGDSWKDEAWTITIIGILVCCFLPFTCNLPFSSSDKALYSSNEYAVLSFFNTSPFEI